MNLTRRVRARLWCERVWWRLYQTAHPYEQLPFRRGTGAWGRVTERDRRHWIEVRAEVQRRIASGEIKPNRYRKDADGRWVDSNEGTVL